MIRGRVRWDGVRKKAASSSGSEIDGEEEVEKVEHPARIERWRHVTVIIVHRRRLSGPHKGRL